MHRKSKFLEIILLILILTLALGLRIYKLSELPGLYYDEPEDGLDAIKIINGESFPKENSLMERFPLISTSCSYIGSTGLYLTFIFFELFGVSVFTLRIVNIFFAILAIGINYFLVKELFNKKIALISTILFSTFPTFVFFSRIGSVNEDLFIFFTVAILFCLLRFYRTKKSYYIYLSSLLIGLGLNTKLSFVFIIIALFFTKLILKVKIKLNLKEKELSFVFFLIGSFLFLYYNLLTFGTLDVILKNFTVTTLGVSNLSYIDNFLIRLKQLWDFLNGNGILWIGSGPFYNDIYPLFFLAAIIFSIWYSIKYKDKKLLFLTVFLLILIILSPFTITGLKLFHLLILLPIPFILISVFLNHVMKDYKFVILITVLIVIFDFNLIYSYYKDFDRTYGGYFFSTEINKLTNYLIQKNYTDVVTPFGFLSRQLIFLSQGKLKPIEMGHLWDETIYKNELIKLFNKNRIYAYINPNYSPTIKYQYWFFEVLNETGKSFIFERDFINPNNMTIYYVYRVI